MTDGVGIAPGKLVLVGEHAVVYGHPAIAFAVDRTTRVTLTARPGTTSLTGTEPDARLQEALFTVLPPEGFGVTVTSDVPIGRGMGSSAALAVALVRAFASQSGEALDSDGEFARAMPMERSFHGNPSGVDVAVSVLGGCLWFCRGNGEHPAVREPLPPVAGRIVVLDSGKPGDTAALVAGVAAQRPGIDALLERIGALVHEARAVLADPKALGPLLTENHRLLRGIGVSTPALDGLVELALAHGAYGAKLAGAGGGGVVLALVDDPAPLLTAAAARGIPAFGSNPCQPPV